MTGQPGVVVLLQNPTTEVFVPGDNDLAAEIEQTGVYMPLSGPGGPGASDFEKLPRHERHGVLEVRFVSERLANVSEERYFWAGNYDTFQRSDVEKVWTQERHICIVLTRPMVRPPAEPLSVQACGEV
jgi:hypothetical protein